MNNVAYLRTEEDAGLDTAQVLSLRNDNEYTVCIGSSQYRAEQAYGCLVKPEVGDTVLVLHAQSVYILSVLKRPEERQATQRIVFRGPAHMTAPYGDLQISGQEDVRVSSRQCLDLSSVDMSMTAAQLEARFDRLNWIGRLVNGQVKRMRLVAEAVDQVVRRSVMRLTDSFRYIKGHEEVQAQSTRLLVDQTMVVQTGHTMHTAKGHVKIDAEQIHIG